MTTSGKGHTLYYQSITRPPGSGKGGTWSQTGTPSHLLRRFQTTVSIFPGRTLLTISTGRTATKRQRQQSQTLQYSPNDTRTPSRRAFNDDPVGHRGGFRTEDGHR